ncbi:helix-turn-helix domain-containing protein [Dyadobacter subterraneus]|uniref:Helix-turn-helix transcriptional regulator n=1 Tax=Dyadobacter subterraneus TaxID=2773304 RepID=A0ABR9WBJ6_9BACT|nr:AraC family transcriptional regulator [Dyadobacter subterraneus]MBE9462805.1 helix-turn-helix transcriptional regulator [Dyadobacter subterraneus]
MSKTTNPNVPQIIYSATSKRTIEGEIFIKQHVFDYIISGTSETYFDGKSRTYQAGDFRLAVKNRLSKFVKIPPVGGEYRSVSICIDQDTLLELKDQYRPDEIIHKPYDNVLLIKPNRLFNNYIDSLLPYLENSRDISGNLIKLKVKEAVLIFLEANPLLKNILFDFSEPGKIDLEAYMRAHYNFNGSLSQFAYLTGRSLSTFKRDFSRIFNTTPNKWLLNKRLEDARYLIQEKKWKATDVYIEVGFKDYSHFSVAYKHLFGQSPSMR